MAQTKQNVHAVIMAGGVGSRFWPLSTAARPKQLLNLANANESLLRGTLRRLKDIVAIEHVWIVTSEALQVAIRTELPELPDDNVLAEPVGRNTATCIGWAAAHIRRQDPDAVLLVLPADHHIANVDAFAGTLRRSIALADQGHLVTIGVQPTRAETGYGYLETGESLGDGVFRAQRFVEKPDLASATAFVESGGFLWNSGMFAFRAAAILQAIQQHLPALATALDAIDQAAKRGEERAALAKLYPGLPAVSIDHGVMEKSADLLVVSGDFGWSDLGSWTSAWELASKDEAGNSLGSASAFCLEADGCYLRTQAGKKVALIGIRDLVVVDTADALLIMSRQAAQDVRQAAEHFASKAPSHPERPTP